MSRRQYSKEYKQEAVQLAQQSHTSVTEVARNLGINNTMLRRWIKESNEPAKQAFTGQGSPRDEEISQLKRELAQVKRERDFLREAAAYFVKHPK